VFIAVQSRTCLLYASLEGKQKAVCVATQIFNSLTQRSAFLLGRIIVPELVKKFPQFLKSGSSLPCLQERFPYPHVKAD
jgi:hypothetical protein